MRYFGLKKLTVFENTKNNGFVKFEFRVQNLNFHFLKSRKPLKNEN